MLMQAVAHQAGNQLSNDAGVWSISLAAAKSKAPRTRSPDLQKRDGIQELMVDTDRDCNALS